MKTSANPAEIKELDRLMTGLRELDRKISATESIGVPIEDRFPAITDELDRAEAVFTQHGFQPQHPHPALRADLRHQVLIGAISIGGGRNFLVTAGQDRLRRQFEAAGGESMTESAKALALQELRRQRRARAALLEASWRSMESNGLSISRPDDLVDPELYLLDENSLLTVAKGAEAAA
jgi:phosphoglycerate dehydrogenase-like enzyme